MFAVDSLLMNYGGKTYNNPEEWAQCRENIAEAYRDRFACGEPSNMQSSARATMRTISQAGDYGQALDKEMVTDTVVAPQAPWCTQVVIT